MKDLNFFDNERGVSVVLGAILVLMILMLILPPLYQTYVRSNMTENEARQMSTVQDKFLSIQSTSSHLNGPDSGGSIGLPMNADSVSLFPGNSPAGSLKMNPGTGITANISDDTVNITLDPGSMEYVGNNLYYPDQTYVYETGHIFMKQGDKELLVSPYENFLTTGNSIKINYFKLEKSSSISSTGSESINIAWGGKERMPRNAKWMNSSKISLKINTDNQEAWMTYLNQTKNNIAEANVETGTDNGKPYINMENSTGINFYVTETKISNSNSDIEEPTTKTNNVKKSWSDAAILNMSYDFKDYNQGDVQFRYKPDNGSWSFTSSETKYGSNSSYTRLIKDLKPDTEYSYQAQIRYGTETQSGEIKEFTPKGDPYTNETGISPGAGLGDVSEYSLSDQSETISVPNGLWKGIIRTDQIILSDAVTTISDTERSFLWWNWNVQGEYVAIKFTLENATNRYRIGIVVEEASNNRVEVSIYSTENGEEYKGDFKDSVKEKFLEGTDLYNGVDLLNKANYQDVQNGYYEYLREISKMDSSNVEFLTQEIKGRVSVTLREESLFTSIEPKPDDNSLYQTKFIKLFFESPTDLDGWKIRDNEGTTPLPNGNIKGELYIAKNKSRFISLYPGIDENRVADLKNLQSVGTPISFNSTGNALELIDSNGNLRDEVAYGTDSTSNGYSLDINEEDVAYREKYVGGEFDGVYIDSDSESDWDDKDGRSGALITGLEPKPYGGNQTEFVRLFFEDNTNLDEWNLEDSGGNNYLPDYIHQGELYLVNNEEEFKSSYPKINDSLIDEVNLSLDNSGDSLELIDSNSNLRDEVAYGDSSTSNEWNITIKTNEVAFRDKYNNGAFKDTNSAGDWNTEVKKDLGLITAVEPNSSKYPDFIRILLVSDGTWEINNNEGTIKEVNGSKYKGEIYVTNNETKLLEKHTQLNQSQVLENQLMTLNNTGEALKLYNSNNKLIDEAAYGNKNTTNNWNITINNNEIALRKMNTNEKYIDTNTSNDWTTLNETIWSTTDETKLPHVNYNTSKLDTITYNEDAIAKDGEDENGIPGGVEFSVSNYWDSEVRIDSIEIDPLNDNINEIDDKVGGEGIRKSEIAINNQYSDFGTSGNDYEALAIEDDGVTVEVGLDGYYYSGELPKMNSWSNSTIYLYEFYEFDGEWYENEYRDNDNINMAGEELNITINYSVNGEQKSSSFLVVPE